MGRFDCIWLLVFNVTFNNIAIISCQPCYHGLHCRMIKKTYIGLYSKMKKMGRENMCIRKTPNTKQSHNYYVLYMPLWSWWLDLQLPIQLVPITTNVMSSNPSHCEVYSIQHYVIKFVSDLRQVGGFLWFPPPIKLIVTI
jgi:hypothetical protein